MNPSALLKRVDEMLANESIISGRTYDYVRGHNGNLYVMFQNEDIFEFPPFPFRPYQRIAQNDLFILHKRFHYYIWPRRHGKEYTSWNLLLQAAIMDPGLYLMIYPTNVRARMVLWEGNILLPNGRSVNFRDMIPKEFLAKKPADDDMTIKLINGSVIWVLGSDIDPDKLRGTNPRGVVCSEFAYSDPRVRVILMPALRQNDGWMILQSTYNGMNHAYHLMQDVRTNPEWVCKVETVVTLVDEQGRRYVTDDMIDEERRSGMPEFMIQQEYYSAVELNQETLYFANELNVLRRTGRLVDDYFIPQKRARLHMDIGVNDKTAIILEQMDEHGNPVIIAYTENNNKMFEYYIRWAEAECVKRGLQLDANIYSPHDGKKKEFSTLKTLVDYGREMGYIVHIVERPKSKIDAIQAMRKMLYRVKISKSSCERLLDCLSNYSKEYDEKRGIYKDKPLHDWASHAVDAFQTMTLAYDSKKITERTYDIVYINQLGI